MKDHSSALKAIKCLKGYLLNGNRLNIEVKTFLLLLANAIMFIYDLMVLLNLKVVNKINPRPQQIWESRGFQVTFYSNVHYSELFDNVQHCCRYDDFSGSSYGRGNFQGRVLRGRGIAPPRFDPYKTSGPRRPLLEDYNSSSMYSSQARPPLLSNNPGMGSTDGFARELLDLYLKNPVAFDRYARDPLVQQSLSMNPEDDSGAIDPYYGPPREYFEKKP